MPIKNSRYYNDPNIGAAFDNIAGMFAPPDSGDAANYATAAAKKEEAARAAKAFAYAEDPNFNWEQADRYGVLAGMYAGNASLQAVDRNNATSRSNNAADNSRALQTNAADNTRALNSSRETALLAPVGQGETRFVPPSIADLFGTGPTQVGTPKPMSETEWDAAQKQRLLATGQLKDADLFAKIMGDVPVENVVGPKGTPVISRRTDAVGQQPYFNKGAEAKPDIANYRTPSGVQGTAMFVDGKGMVDTQTGDPLPPGTPTYKATAQGSTDEIGMGTKTNLTQAQALRASVSNSNGIVNDLEKLVIDNPATTGMAGDIIGFAQDARQVVAEFGEAFGKDANSLISAEDMQKFSQQVLGADTEYNPAYRQARALLLELAYANAQMNNPSGEVSRFALERELEQLGQGVVGNDKGLLAVIDISRDRMRRKLNQAEVLAGTAAPLTPDQIGQGTRREVPETGGEEEWVRDASGQLVRAK